MDVLVLIESLYFFATLLLSSRNCLTEWALVLRRKRLKDYWKRCKSSSLKGVKVITVHILLIITSPYTMKYTNEERP